MKYGDGEAYPLVGGSDNGIVHIPGLSDSKKSEREDHTVSKRRRGGGYAAGSQSRWYGTIKKRADK